MSSIDAVDIPYWNWISGMMFTATDAYKEQGNLLFHRGLFKWSSWTHYPDTRGMLLLNTSR